MSRTTGIWKAPRANIITLSFQGDFEVCRLLCASFDRYAQEGFLHSLYVPAADIPLFANLGAERRRIATQESLLPWWFRKTPMPASPWRERLFLPRRNVYLTPFSLPVRGWIAQQIMKIAAALKSESDVLAFLDSDNALVRPLSIAHLMRAGKIRHYHNTDHPEILEQRRWYDEARRLLGLPRNDPYRPGYIHPMIVWRRQVVQGMIQRIESTTGQSWVVALARTQHFAEYNIYGLYAEQILGLEAAGLYAESRPLVHSCWSRRIESAAETADFVAALEPDHVACNIQSTTGMTIEERTKILNELALRARKQDAETAKR
jgi:hypothetical protein